MNYTLSLNNRVSASDLYGVYPSGSAYPLDYFGVPTESSRSDSSGQPKVIITFDEDTLEIPDVKTLSGSFFTILRTRYDDELSQSSAIAVRIAAYLSSQKPHCVPPIEKLEETCSIFSFNVTQAAEVFGVSRTAIYDWREGKTLSQKHRDRISKIHEFALALKKLNSTPLGEALTWEDAESGQSLFSLLKAEPLDVARIHRFIEALPARIHAWWAPANALIDRNKKDDWAPVPDTLREATRSRLAGRNVRSGRSNPEIP